MLPDEHLIAQAQIHATGANIHTVLSWIDSYYCFVYTANNYRQIDINIAKEEDEKARQQERKLRMLVHCGDVRKVIEELDH